MTYPTTITHSGKTIGINNSAQFSSQPDRPIPFAVIANIIADVERGYEFGSGLYPDITTESFSWAVIS